MLSSNMLYFMYIVFVHIYNDTFEMSYNLNLLQYIIVILNTFKDVSEYLDTLTFIVYLILIFFVAVGTTIVIVLPKYL